MSRIVADRAGVAEAGPAGLALGLALAGLFAWSLLTAGCGSRNAQGTSPKPAAGPSDRGTVVLCRVGGVGGVATVATITPDGLVRWWTAQGEGIGQCEPKDVLSLVASAKKYGFFTWRATYEPREMPPDCLVTTIKLTLEDGKQHVVTAQTGADAPALLHDLFAVASEIDLRARQRPLPPDIAPAVEAAKALYERVKGDYSAEQLEQGPCLADEVIPGWAVDIVHEPRVRADNLVKNQCQAFRRGRVAHIVELAPNGDFIRAR